MKKWLLFCAAALYVLLWTAATVYDYPISVWMTAHNPVLWSETASRVGPLPVHLLFAFCTAALAEKRNAGRGPLLVISFLFSVLAAWNLFRPSLHDAFLLLLMAGTSILLFTGIRKLAERVPDGEGTDRILIGGIAAAVLAVAISEVIKCTWARPRFMFLQELGVSFRPWYLPDGFVLFDDRWKSFPSGHTISASLSMYAVFLAGLFPETCRRKKAIAAAAVLFTLFTAAGRIFAGRHFLSDTLAGMGLGWLLIALIAVRYLRYTSR